MQLPLVQSESKVHPFIFCQQCRPVHSSPILQSESESQAPIAWEHVPAVHSSSLPQSMSNLHPPGFVNGEHLPNSQLLLMHCKSEVQLSGELESAPV